jgi:hypothetical protein
MDRVKSRRTVAITLASTVIHILLISALVIGVPLSGPPRAPEQPVIQVTLEPPPAELEAVRPKKPAKHSAAAAAPATPLAAAPRAAQMAPSLPSNPPAADAGASAAMNDLVHALRGSVGCSNPDAVGLTPSEREACRRRLHAGLEEAKPLSGLTAEKRARFDRAVKCHQDYEVAAMPPVHGESTGPIQGLGYIPRLRDCPPSAQ